MCLLMADPHHLDQPVQLDMILRVADIIENVMIRLGDTVLQRT